MSGQGHKQHGDMRDRAVIPGGGPADDRRILHGDRQQPRKTTFHRGSLIIDRLEALRAVIDGVADTGGEPHKIVAPLLVREFRMSGGTEEILSPIGFFPMQRAGVLKIGMPFRFHPPLPIHGEAGRTEDSILLETKGIVPFSAGIERDDGMGFHFEGNEREDVFGVIMGVSGDRRNRESQGRNLSEHGNGDSRFIPIVGKGDFIKRKLGGGVEDDMVSIAPVERHLRLEGPGEKDFDAETGVEIAAGEFRFVETVLLERGFEVVLPDIGFDGARIQGQDVAGDDVFFDERPDESFPDILQVRVGCCSKETGESFQRGRMLKGRKSAGRGEGGVVFQFEGQIGQRRKAAKMLIDQSTKKGVSRKGGTSSGVDFLSQCRQVGKQFFETDSGRDFFGRKE